MPTLIAYIPVMIAALVACSLYAGWKLRGGSLVKLGKPGEGSVPFVWKLLFVIGYVGFSIGMVAWVAFVALVLRILLIVAAVGAFEAGNAAAGSYAIAATVLTLVYSAVSVRHYLTTGPR